MSDMQDKTPGMPQLSATFERYRRTLMKVVARIVKPHEIEDIVQETYVRIFQASQKQQIHHPKSFMVKTARNLAINYATRADAMNFVVSPAVSDDGTEVDADLFAEFQEMSEPLESVLQSQEEFLIFCRAISELPLQCRRAFILKKVYGLSQQEVAARLGISESTVEKHIAKGLDSCSDYMESHGYDRSRSATMSRQKSG